MLEGAAETGVYFDATTDERWRADHPDWNEGLRRASVVLLAYTSPGAYIARYGEADKASSGLGSGEDAWPVPYWYGDAAFGVMTVLLAAVDAGLGSCVLGTFRGEGELAGRLGVPDGWKLFCAVVLGHPDGRAHRSASLDRKSPGTRQASGTAAAGADSRARLGSARLGSGPDPGSVQCDGSGRRLLGQDVLRPLLRARAMAHNRSDSRLRYATTSEPSPIGSTTAKRSARRTMTRANQSQRCTRFSPGTVKSLGMSKRARRSSIPASRAATMSGVTRLDPACSFVRLSGAVATSAINT